MTTYGNSLGDPWVPLNVIVARATRLTIAKSLQTLGPTLQGESAMNRRFCALVGVSAAALLTAGSVSFAAEDTKPPMHMHKSNMDHRKDSEVAAEYKSEATQLHEKAESHRKLAEIYKTRTPPKGSASYANVAQHCEKLAKYYDDAAKEAEAVSSELNKQ
jgi:hypothetical protein